MNDINNTYTKNIILIVNLIKKSDFSKKIDKNVKKLIHNYC